MNVTGQDHGVLNALLFNEIEQLFTLAGIAIPLIHINSNQRTEFIGGYARQQPLQFENLQLSEHDLLPDKFPDTGAGGQHVNKTDSAIRITHIPTNIVVQCQNDRSQHRNRATAMNMLKARLYELELQKREQAANDAASAKTDIGWGNQIRSYVLHPYQMVKDLRTNIEKGNAGGVLDGDLDDFVEASLAARVGAQREG